MSSRDFSDTVKLEAIKANLKNNNGEIHCANCDNKLMSIEECHFDHIYPYAKGGKSILSNCQILCVDCNLRKNDKELKDFVLEEKAKRFLNGISLSKDEQNVIERSQIEDESEITKKLFDELISEFIRTQGDIHKVDFGREYNHLPSFRYVHQYYGDLNSLKKAFGIENLSYNWDREKIKQALNSYISMHGGITQNDLMKANKLPSLPCILSNYPECKNFTDVKRIICNMDVPEPWTVENAILAGKAFVDTHGEITQKDLRSSNHLPSNKVIERLFGSLSEYQRMIGAKISQKNEFISKQEINSAVEEFFEGKQRIVDSQKEFFKIFLYSQSTILKRYGTFSDFCKEYNIQVLKTKKAKYTKKEVDDAIFQWVKKGNKIPSAKDLSKLGLPSLDVILKFYKDWKEPFYFYEKMYEMLNRN